MRTKRYRKATRTTARGTLRTVFERLFSRGENGKLRSLASNIFGWTQGEGREGGGEVEDLSIDNVCRLGQVFRESRNSLTQARLDLLYSWAGRCEARNRIKREMWGSRCGPSRAPARRTRWRILRLCRAPRWCNRGHARDTDETKPIAGRQNGHRIAQREMMREGPFL